MGIAAMSWDQEAKTLGYTSEREMLVDLYEKQEWGLTPIAERLGYSKANVRHRLESHGIKLRGRGGPRRLGMVSLKDVPDSELKNTTYVAKKYGVHYSTVNKEQRRRKALCNSALSSPSNISNDGVVDLPSELSSSWLSGALEAETTSPSSSTEVCEEIASSLTTEPMSETG